LLMTRTPHTQCPASTTSRRFRKLQYLLKAGRSASWRTRAAGKSGDQQSVSSPLTEGREDPPTGSRNASELSRPCSIQHSASRPAHPRRSRHRRHTALQSEDINFYVSFLFGGRSTGLAGCGCSWSNPRASHRMHHHQPYCKSTASTIRQTCARPRHSQQGETQYCHLLQPQLEWNARDIPTKGRM